MQTFMEGNSISVMAAKLEVVAEYHTKKNKKAMERISKIHLKIEKLIYKCKDRKY